MTKQLAGVFLTALLLAACGCGQSDSGCTSSACLDQCLASGYLTGACTSTGCECSGHSGADGDADADADADVGHDDAGAGDGAVDHGTGFHDQCAATMQYSYIWISDTGEGKVSKLCTLDGVEVARYWSSPQLTTGDPSRTSVNLHGDAVVTNRDTTGGPSSVTKFAGLLEDCVDRNGDHIIQTSTGPTDVLPWGDDECMLWNTPLNPGGSAGIGARATAWDGTEDADTGEGGHIWIGALNTGDVFQLDGDDGTVVQHTTVTNMPYGGVIDGVGNFWIVGGMCTVGACRLARVNTSTLDVEYVSVPCGYGISADAHHRIWTSGSTGFGSCVNRHDPAATPPDTTYRAAGITNFFRGLAVDNHGSVWVANTSGDVLQISEADVTLTNTVAGIAPEAVVGVAIDFQGNVWAVSQGGNEAVKINPTTLAFEHFPVGSQPYTYSDMTGYQLRTVIFM